MHRGQLWHNGDVGLMLVARSASHTLFKGILNTYYPEWTYSEQIEDIKENRRRWHPINSYNPENIIDTRNSDPSDLEFAVMVRNPVDRIQSSCARVGVTVEEALANESDDVHFWSLKSMGVLDYPNVRYFLFPEQIQECADYLGIGTVEHLNAEWDKTELTEEQISAIRAAYAEDVALYESLMNDYISPE